MAHGIDGISQKSTVNYGGKTIAVLGSSLNEKSIYPKTNLSLYHRILDNGGLILSEYHHRESTLPYKFVARNRIISAICSGLIVRRRQNPLGSLRRTDACRHSRVWQ